MHYMAICITWRHRAGTGRDSKAVLGLPALRAHTVCVRLCAHTVMCVCVPTAVAETCTRLRPLPTVEPPVGCDSSASFSLVVTRRTQPAARQGDPGQCALGLAEEVEHAQRAAAVGGRGVADGALAVAAQPLQPPARAGADRLIKHHDPVAAARRHSDARLAPLLTLLQPQLHVPAHEPCMQAGHHAGGACERHKARLASDKRSGCLGEPRLPTEKLMPGAPGCMHALHASVHVWNIPATSVGTLTAPCHSQVCVGHVRGLCLP